MHREVAWLVLHGSESHNSGAVSFETALGGVVALLVVVGALWYLGVFESLGADADVEADPDPESEAGD